MKISKVYPDGVADELGLEVGDKILEINGEKISDIIDLSFEIAEEDIEMLVECADGDRMLIQFTKKLDEEIGAEFESAVKRVRRCKNHCVFCFVDMMPPKMRKTLYVKDDDYRLSFLYGNFITLTNLTDKDYWRIKTYHLSPLYVSIHAMRDKVRGKLLRNPDAEDISYHLWMLEHAGAEYHTQVVLCPNVNDGEELDYTITKLLEHRPHVLSLAIVPVGVTKFRHDDFPLEQFDKAGAAKVIDQVEKFQKKIRKECGKTFVYLGDEFYFLANRKLPPAEFYDGYPQIENGIGMTRNFIEEFKQERKNFRAGDTPKLTVDVIAGVAVAGILRKMAESEMARNKNLDVRVLPVVNNFFGSRVNVSGLLTGRDIIAALEENNRERDKILIPASALRKGENIFLDNVKLAALQKKFSVPVEPIATGAEYFRAITNH